MGRLIYSIPKAITIRLADISGKEERMAKEKLPQLLAGISLAGLVAGVSLAAPGQVHGASG